MQLFEDIRDVIDETDPVGITGRVASVNAMRVGVTDFPASVGTGVRIEHGGVDLKGKVISFTDGHAIVTPLGRTDGISLGDRVTTTSDFQTVPVGTDMLGRVIDAFGEPIDGGSEFATEVRKSIRTRSIPPAERLPIEAPLTTGIRVVDSLLTVGRGERVGVFSPGGAERTVFLEMLSRFSNADVTVIALIGPRTHEARGLIDKALQSEGADRRVVVLSMADDPPLVRVQAAGVAATVAEHFRDHGCDVLLVVDSMTNLAAAQRQIGSACGEVPFVKGYPPSVFDVVSRLLERSGRTQTGSITGFYSAHLEPRNQGCPICETIREGAEGSIFLSRSLSQRGLDPPIDVLRSLRI
jgi:FliI/YscN family ATPase